MIEYDNSAIGSGFLSAAEPELLTSEQLNSVLNQLTSTIEISTLSSLYFTQVNRFLPLIGLDLSEFIDDLTIGFADDAVRITLPVAGVTAGNDKTSAFVIYYFDADLSPTQRRILAHLHQTFVRPLMHALEFRRLKQMATKDSLTNLGNRNGFDEAAQRMINRSTRQDNTFGLLVVDLDNFKQVNDKFGHQQGDNVLREMAAILAESIRGHEDAYRFGGDEFCCLLDVTSSKELSIVAARIQDAVNRHPLFKRHSVTCSIGGALFKSGDEVGDIFNRADKALYEAKEDGKGTYQAA